MRGSVYRVAHLANSEEEVVLQEICRKALNFFRESGREHECLTLALGRHAKLFHHLGEGEREGEKGGERRKKGERGKERERK